MPLYQLFRVAQLLVKGTLAIKESNNQKARVAEIVRHMSVQAAARQEWPAEWVSLHATMAKEIDEVCRRDAEKYRFATYEEFLIENLHTVHDRIVDKAAKLGVSLASPSKFTWPKH